MKKLIATLFLSAAVAQQVIELETQGRLLRAPHGNPLTPTEDTEEEASVDVFVPKFEEKI
jgi:hypothetical protein